MACDTSVLVPALLPWHAEHEPSRARLRDAVDHVPAHVLLETFSVLTRLPSPHRIAAADASSVLGALSLKVVTLPASQHPGLVTTLADRGLRGGAIYDALVGRTATHHGLTLLTRDRRAAATYDAVAVAYTLL
ncbi:ribonuclease [Knoellia subterranea KCTC 19937]|uniref:Ribonuclease VapC n=1 Tax=Knoellia subterranea KCTC 19937 TaxID=1385521 RepID=A0A0A0JNB6_9MICO|nr:ribonuclease [Knoellia subterranea KCTC 19937]